MMKSSKTSTIILMMALTLTTILGAGVFSPRSAVVAKVRAGEPLPGSLNRIPGIVITVKSRSNGAVLKQIAYDDNGGTFTVGGLEPGRYYIRVECKKCASLDIGKARIRVTLTGTKEGRFTRTISKQQLVAGIDLTLNVTKNTVRGHVTLIK